MEETSKKNTDIDEKPLDDKHSGSQDDIFLTFTETEEIEPGFGKREWNEEKVNDYYIGLSSSELNLLLEKCGHGHSTTDREELNDELKYVLDKMINMTEERVLHIFDQTIKEHDHDVNFPEDDWSFITDYVCGELSLDDTMVKFRAKLTATLFYYHSIYPEVRAVTDIFDDEEPCETIRSYTIAIIWVIIASGVNEFFYHRQPAISLSSSVISVLMYPCGKAWEYVMPNVMVPWFGGKIPLNPGPYSYKEQMFATILSGVSGTTVYVSSNIIVQRLFFKNTWVDFGYQFLLTMSTQFIGLSFAGILRKFCIYPDRAVWPTFLPTLALNRALLKPERKEVIHGWKISRYNFFWIVFASMFCYFWLPDYIFGALSTFNWMTWIKPTNFNLAMVTGSVSGLGLNPVPTFDWNVVSMLMNPLAMPWITIWNMYLGAVVGFVIIIAMYYSNYYWTAYLPINSNDIFTNTGESYEVTEVVTNGLLDPQKYQKYSPPFYSAANLLVYGAFFAVYPLSFFYNSYKEWYTIKKAIAMTSSGVEDMLKGDPTSRMMRKYKEVPDWYYVTILIIAFILSILTVEVYKETKTPVWGLFFVLAINFVFLIPFSVLVATTGVQFGLNVLVELIVGYALSGNGIALMTLKAFGYNIDGQADGFVSSLKIGHYARIPPRAIFRAQIIGTFIQCFVSLGVVNWSMSNIEDFCQPHQSSKFTCPSERTFYSAAVFWGTIGPKIVFSGLYPTMQYAFLMGFGIALVFIVMRRFGGKSTWYKYFGKLEPTVIIGGILSTYAPYNLTYLTGALYFGFLFMYYIRRRYVAWFEKYDYVISAALSAGVAFSAIIIFFAVQYHAKDINWWGNTVMYDGVDGGAGQVALYDISATERGYFGPERGNYPTT
ncbi:small oligopeptide transporter [Cyberlindnera jadinii NRRL Y-1542]|uniref:Small oligopeptide transporter n=1 Tax=Cyberlindnera jadinii (strain ATCC 18201 / CBS 1600 / BCRC 20928 / JCM 3617 / NBRC 0987 / NRRL Y-1542) TaxID=983966 RepID=A0A1E4S7U1_CYBJN|nr:small oligopeptide transporter [Cyberlindnera jadinii NRRL Y-1542]ODV75575.1 small oligopeptide transporter [Cyberlindnera jadinii NRRL Y-1542]